MAAASDTFVLRWKRQAASFGKPWICSGFFLNGGAAGCIDLDVSTPKGACTAAHVVLRD